MDKVKFTIECEMEGRWVPHFLAMLFYMEQLGNWGSSREVGIMADGDGDFRPKFTWDEKFDNQLLDIKPVRDIDGDRLYDAG